MTVANQVVVIKIIPPLHEILYTSEDFILAVVDIVVYVLVYKIGEKVELNYKGIDFTEQDVIIYVIIYPVILSKIQRSISNFEHDSSLVYIAVNYDKDAMIGAS